MEKLSKETFWEIDADKINELIKKHTGLEYDFIADEERHNGYTPFYNITAEDHSNSIEEVKNDSWGELRYRIYSHDILSHLVFLGVLPEGNYLIDHSW